MGEAIIAAGGRTNDGSPKLKWVDFVEIITENREYTVPECRNQEIEVLLVGGGGGSRGGGNYSGYAGGGGGYYNRSTVQVSPGSIIPINIGDDGNRNESGGTTIFGPYLSAAGASTSGSSGGGGFVAIETFRNYHEGGSWSYEARWACIGSGSGNFGGGGGGALIARLEAGVLQSGCLCEVVYGGSGGKYGGGGGGAGWFNINTWSSTWGWFNGIGYSPSGSGGEFGGNGGYVERNTNNIANNGNNGTNTIGWTNIERYALNSNIFFNGEGKGSNSTGLANSNSAMKFVGAAGAGGGFGGNGGAGEASGRVGDSNFHSAGGGGGGYGADGGRGSCSYYYAAGGGGGGWGDNGGNGGSSWGGYGGGYGPAGYGRGGSGGGKGANGVCILKYQKLVYV